MIQVQNQPYMQGQQFHLIPPTVAKTVLFMAGVFSFLIISAISLYLKGYLCLFLFVLHFFFLTGEKASI